MQESNQFESLYHDEDVVDIVRDIEDFSYIEPTYEVTAVGYTAEDKESKVFKTLFVTSKAEDAHAYINAVGQDNLKDLFANEDTAYVKLFLDMVVLDGGGRHELMSTLIKVVIRTGEIYTKGMFD